MYVTHYKDVVNMKIGEAQQLYREQVKAYQAQKVSLSKQLEHAKKQMKYLSDEDDPFGSEAATLELSIQALDEKQSEYYDYLEKLAEQHCAYWNAAVSEQQGDALEDAAVELSKIMEVARRIMKGAIVPASDEKKLMEYSSELYQAAKNIGAMAQREKKEEYESLWDEDEEEKVYDDPQEVADNTECSSDGPEIVDAADTVSSVAGE